MSEPTPPGATASHRQLHGPPRRLWRLLTGIAAVVALTLVAPIWVTPADATGQTPLTGPRSASVVQTERAPGPGTAGDTILGGTSGSFETNPDPDQWPKTKIGSFTVGGQAGWSTLETAPGSWDFSRLDDIVTAAEDHGARPVLLLSQTPKFRVSDPATIPTHTNGLPGYWAAVPNQTAWRDYVERVSSRYGDRADYRIWNEPSAPMFWGGNITQMAALIGDAAPIIRRNAPNAVIASPALPLRRAYQRTYFTRLLAASTPDGSTVGNTVDVVAINPYPLPKQGPEAAFRLVQAARNLMASIGVDRPVAVTELNYGVTGFVSPPVRRHPATQAAWTARTVALMAGARVQAFTWYSWNSHWYEGVEVRDRETGGLTAAGRAWNRVADWTSGTTPTRCQARRDGDWVCRFATADGARRDVWWHPGGGGSLSVRHHGNLVALDGTTRAVKPGQRVRLGDAPVMVTYSATK